MNDLTPNSSPAVRPFASEEPAVTVPVFHPPISPEDQTLFFPHAEGTPPPDPPVRIPHLGHAALFLAIAFLFFLVFRLAAVGLSHPQLANKQIPINPKLALGSQALTYLATLAVAWLIFPLLWKRPFAEGLQLNPDAARRNAFRLIPIGFVLSLTFYSISSLIPLPKEIPMDDFLRTASDVWFVTIFGTLIAPLFEEIVFRGFLLPGFAIAYDWLSLPRTPAAHETWRSNNKLTRASLVFSAVLTSILFALIHGFQTAFTWPVLLLLFCVSLVLSYVRIRLRSVLASTLIHVSYNGTIFVFAFIATGGYRHLERMTH